MGSPSSRTDPQMRRPLPRIPAGERAGAALPGELPPAHRHAVGKSEVGQLPVEITSPWLLATPGYPPNYLTRNNTDESVPVPSSPPLYFPALAS